MSELQAIDNLITCAIERRQKWARGAFVCSCERSAFCNGINVFINDGKLGRGVKCAAIRIPMEMLNIRDGYDALDRLDAYIDSQLDYALAKCGFTPFKRTTRWRIDRHGRRQWQAGQVAK